MEKKNSSSTNKSSNGSSKNSNNNDILKIITNYFGAIIGGVIALILACTSLYRVVIGIVLVCIGAWFGYYCQHYKENVKNKLRTFVDKL